MIESAKNSKTAAEEAGTSGGCYVVPAPIELSAHYWNLYARGTNRNQLICATRESVCFQVYDVFFALESDTGTKFTECKIDGDASDNDFLMQRQLKILQIQVRRPESVETTAIGVAYIARTGSRLLGRYIEEVKANLKGNTLFSPEILEHQTRNKDCWLGTYSKACHRNKDIVAALVTQSDVEIFNLGMQDSAEENPVTYIQTGIMSAILLKCDLCDIVVDGCGTGQGYLNSVMQFQNVVCGLIQDSLATWLFSKINNGNCISLASSLQYGYFRFRDIDDRIKNEAVY